MDANVVLDVLQERTPHLSASGGVWLAAENGEVEAFLSAHALTTIYYLMRKDVGQERAYGMLSRLVAVFRIAPVDSAIIRIAVDSAWVDFEDAVTAAAAEKAGCEAIITRDQGGFKSSRLRVMTPVEALSLLRLSPR